MNTLEKFIEEYNKNHEVNKPLEETLVEYPLTCQPGSEFWYLENFIGVPLGLKKGIAQTVGFTTDNIQITPVTESSKTITRPYIWGKTAFATEDEARQALAEFAKRTPFTFLKDFTKDAANSVAANKAKSEEATTTENT